MKKKLFLLLFGLSVLSMTTSCSSSDDSPTPTPKVSVVVATVGGVAKTYSTVTLTPDPVTPANTLVSASVPGSTTETKITFGVVPNQIGVFGIYNVQMVYNGVTYKQSLSPDFDSTITFNDAEKFQGTFSGTIVSDDDEELVVTNGDFIIYR